MAKIDYSEFDIELEREVDDREDFDPRSTPYNIEKRIQEAADDIIRDCPDADWNENLISFKIIENIRRILTTYKVPGITEEFSDSAFDFEAYKLTGNAEKFHGDIAFVITRRFSNNSDPISGVAFYEAKASSNDRYNIRKFPSFCTHQLRRLVTHTPKLNYLIYSKEGCSVGRDDWPFWDGNKFGSFRENVHAAVIDANFLKKNRNIQFSLNTVGLPFGSHFVDRVLSGRELDYSRSVDKTIRRWLKYTRKSSPIIISVSIIGNSGESFCTQLELPGFEKIRLENHIRALENDT